MRTVVLCLICSSLLCLSSASALAAGAATQESPRKLAPGKTLSTFHFVFDGRVRFTLEPGYPAVVSIDAPLVGKVAQKTVADDRPFRLDVNLLPGSYSISSEPSTEKAKAEYWRASGIRFHIDQDGNVFYPFGAADELIHVHRMAGLRPGALAVSQAKRPALKWPAIKGAKHYRGFWEGAHYFRQFSVDDTRFEINEISPGDKCTWGVWAIGDDDRPLAQGIDQFFAFGTDPALAAKARTNPAACSARWPSGPGFLGVRTSGFVVTSDPAQTRVDADGSVEFDEHGKLLPAIRIDELVPGSPAVDAGLRPSDMILTVDGHPVTVGSRTLGSMKLADPEAFTQLIAAVQPGRTIVLTVRRDARDLKISVMMGKPPTKIAPPTTQPR